MDATEKSGTAAAIAMSPPIVRPHPTPRGSTAASESARVGDTREARRPAARTDSSATTTPPTITPAAGSRPEPRAKFGGAIPWRTSPSASAWASFAPGQIPAAEPINATIVASHAIILRIWPGVAATARRSAISCSRSWIAKAIVPVTTNSATKSPIPANDADTAMSRVRPA